jgi:hypothetical protein
MKPSDYKALQKKKKEEAEKKRMAGMKKGGRIKK